VAHTVSKVAGTTCTKQCEDAFPVTCSSAAAGVIVVVLVILVVLVIVVVLGAIVVVLGLRLLVRVLPGNDVISPTVVVVVAVVLVGPDFLPPGEEGQYFL